MCAREFSCGQVAFCESLASHTLVGCFDFGGFDSLFTIL